jgi:hypothetical protein
LSIAAAIVLFAFTPISRALLLSVDGSFAPTPFSSLALRSPSEPATGFQVGDLVPVRLANHTGSTKTYHWSALEHGVIVSLGEKTLLNGRGTNINVPTAFGRPGILRITLTGTDVYITVALERS